MMGAPRWRVVGLVFVLAGWFPCSFLWVCESVCGCVASLGLVHRKMEQSRRSPPRHYSTLLMAASLLFLHGVPN
uniref:Uncharacterized protein n=1 Tax=Anguilla anguilla TaxID=7936 RepID=A0A0E9RHM2_ANGAN